MNPIVQLEPHPHDAARHIDNCVDASERGKVAAYGVYHDNPNTTNVAHTISAGNMPVMMPMNRTAWIGFGSGYMWVFLPVCVPFR